MRFLRLRFMLAAFERGEFDEAGLLSRLGEYLERSPVVPGPKRKPTVAGMPRYEVQP